MGGFSGLAGGLIGGGNTGGIKSPTTLTETQTRAATGQAYADRNSQAISGFQLQDNASVTLSDQGVIEKAFAFLGDLTKASLSQTAKDTASVADAYKSAQQQSGAVNADQLLKWGVAAVVLVAGLLVLGVRK